MNLETVLNLVDRVPWDSIRKQVGFCQSVPNALRGLLSPDERIRESAYWEIENRLFVQGTLYEGAFYVAPFLRALLRADRTSPGRKLVYDLLNEISRGVAADYVSFHFYQPDASCERVLLPIACRNCVACGIRDYLDDVSDAGSPSRASALDLLENFIEHGDHITCDLQDIHKNEKDAHFRNLLERAMKELHI